MEHAIVTLKKGEGRTIKAGGAWIYDNEIANVVGSFDDGDVVLVHDFDGYPMGKGYINRHSKIRVRMLTRHQEQEIDVGPQIIDDHIYLPVRYLFELLDGERSQQLNKIN